MARELAHGWRTTVEQVAREALLSHRYRGERNTAYRLLIVSARFIDASRYLSRDSYRDTVCKYRDTLKKKFFFLVV